MRISKPARAAALFLTFAAPAPAMAQATSFTPPEGCTGFLTVQMKGCMVSNHFTCENDPEGHKRHVSYTEEGPSGASLVDSEYQWLESYGASRQEVLGLPIEDPASLSELFETGEDGYDFTVIDMASGEPVTTRIVGVDRLSGRDGEIDGEPLLGTIFSMRKLDEAGEEELSVTGAQFVSEEYRLFFPGTESITIGERTIEMDNSPVRFVKPGEPGFFTTRPIYGCSVSDAAWSP